MGYKVIEEIGDIWGIGHSCLVKSLSFSIKMFKISNNEYRITNSEW